MLLSCLGRGERLKLRTFLPVRDFHQRFVVLRGTAIAADFVNPILSRVRLEMRGVHGPKGEGSEPSAVITTRNNRSASMSNSEPIF